MSAQPINVVALPVRAPTRLLTKRELARELGRSPRWIELRMREGLPVEPRINPREHARYDLARVRVWLDERAACEPEMTLAEQVRQLAQRVNELEARLSA